MDSCPCRLFRHTPIKVVEFFSGIGGSSFALDRICTASDVTAYDINTNANKVHLFNKPAKKVLSRNITSLTPAEMDEINADLWTMSPPCQPFTRLGLKRDLQDNRTDCLVHLTQNVLSKMKKPPSKFFLENVKGFEQSDACTFVKTVLKELHYTIEEFILSPSHLGIPNSRSRYYLIAYRSKENHSTAVGIDLPIITEVSDDLTFKCPSCCDVLQVRCNVKLSEFLEKQPPDSSFLAINVASKYLRVLDIVTPESTNSCCFTSGYGRMYQATGSILQMNPSSDISKSHGQLDENSVERMRLRFFTPREVANLMSFPHSFCWPSDISTRQMYKLLGNSVNVSVVSWVLWHLLMKSSHP